MVLAWYTIGMVLGTLLGYCWGYSDGKKET